MIACAGDQVKQRQSYPDLQLGVAVDAHVGLLPALRPGAAMIAQQPLAPGLPGSMRTSQRRLARILGGGCRVGRDALQATRPYRPRRSTAPRQLRACRLPRRSGSRRRRPGARRACVAVQRAAGWPRASLVARVRAGPRHRVRRASRTATPPTSPGIRWQSTPACRSRTRRTLTAGCPRGETVPQRRRLQLRELAVATVDARHQNRRRGAAARREHASAGAEAAVGERQQRFVCTLALVLDAVELRASSTGPMRRSAGRRAGAERAAGRAAGRRRPAHRGAR